MSSKLRVSARRYISFHDSGDASKYVKSAEQIPKHTKTLLFARVSHRNQKRKRNLQDQTVDLQKIAMEKSLIVVGEFKIVESGFDSYYLIRAAEKARELGAEVILAESVDRIQRHPSYHSVDFPEARAREIDLKQMAKNTQGMKLYTVIDPNGLGRQHQTRRGMQMKNIGTRKERKAFCIDFIMQMNREGFSSRNIEKALLEKLKVGVSHMTITKWIKEEKKTAKYKTS